MLRLEEKVALITGGASGIGLNYGTELLRNGLKGLSIVDCNKNGQLSVDKLNEEYGGKAIFIEADVANQIQLEDAFKKTVSTFKQLDIVVNNAGIVDENNWLRMVNVNLNAVIQGTLLAFEQYLPNYKSGEEGIILNAGSILGIDYSESAPIYTATKHGVVALGRSLGTPSHYERTKVKIITICPGMTTTALLKESTNNLRYELENLSKYTFQTPEELATVIIGILEKASNGSVWVAEKGNPPYEVEFPDRFQLCKNKDTKKEW